MLYYRQEVREMRNFILKVLKLGVTCLAITTLVLVTSITLIGLHIGGII